MANKSSYIQLYDDETTDDAYKFQIANTQAELSMTDSLGTRPMRFQADSYKFKYGASFASEFDLKQRFDAVEGEVDVLQADPTGANNAQAIADEAVARASADTALTNSLNAEVSRATTAEGVNSAAITAEQTRASAAEAVNAAAVVSEASLRATAVADETAARVAAVANLQGQITNLLSNADPALVDSISELLSHVNAEDASLLGSIATAQALADQNKARLDELTNE